MGMIWDNLSYDAMFCLSIVLSMEKIYVFRKKSIPFPYMRMIQGMGMVWDDFHANEWYGRFNQSHT